jgi:surface carbohydrate biosynthesis protein
MLRKIKFFLLAEKIWAKPPQKKILVYDEASTKFLKRYLRKNDCEIFYLRNTPKRKINMFVILLMLFNFKLSFHKYLEIYIKLVKPKFIITTIDNDLSFYKIKSFYPDATIISIQNSIRMAISDIFSRLKEIKKNHKNLKADYILVYNNFIKKKYSQIINSNFITIGSFVSNKQKKIITKKKYRLVYISDYRNKILKSYKSREAFYGKVDSFLINLAKYAKEKNIKITILGGSTGDQQLKDEINYYKEIFKSNKFSFLKRSINRPKFKILDNSKIVITHNSTLGYEAFGRGVKTAFFTVRAKDKSFISTRFSWPAKQKLKGEFWTNENSLNEINRIMNFLNDIPFKNWNNLTKTKYSEILKFDPDNKKFIRFSQKIRLPIKV